MSTTTSDAPPEAGPPGPPSDRELDRALQRVLDEGRARAREVGPAQVALWAAVEEATRGGKRFRPALVAAAHGATGGTDPESAAVVGAAVELLHTAFVVHDDVIDGDDVRRGRPNASGTFAQEALCTGAPPAAARHLGATAGLLVGDLALAAAIRTVALCPTDRSTTTRLLDLFDRALHTTAAGELTDVRLSVGPAAPDLAEILTMEEQKTSGYSFELPLQAGAVLAGADAATVDRLGAAGRALGLAFQLRDDLLGTFGDPALTGKSALSDLREGKQTPLIAYARRTPLWRRIAGHVGRADLTAGEADTVRRLLEECGARRFVEELAADHVRLGRELLDAAGVPLRRLTVLRLLVDDVEEQAA